MRLKTPGCTEIMMAFTDSPLSPVRGPAKKPKWAQLIRLGGDRVAILFGELRKAVGPVDGIVEGLHYSASEARWVVRYSAGGAELFSVQISPGLLEARVPLSASEAEFLLGKRGLSEAIKEAIRNVAIGARSNELKLPLTDRRRVHSLAKLVTAKNKLLSMTTKPAG